MVKNLICISDIHIDIDNKSDGRTVKSETEKINYFLNQFINYCNNNATEETRIIVAGDIFESKSKITSESFTCAQNFFKELGNITKVYVCAGNHDYNVNNPERENWLNALFNHNISNVTYLDKELNFKSGIYEDENVAFCLYSHFDNFQRPNIEEYKEQNPEKSLIGLIHGEIEGATNASNYVSESNKGDFVIKHNVFENLNFVISGHIHKRQTLTKNGVTVIYCGSLFQQNFGEDVDYHGGVEWDVMREKYKFFDLDNGGYGYYIIEINSVDDIENDDEDWKNKGEKIIDNWDDEELF